LENLIEDFKKKLKSRGFFPEFFENRKSDNNWDINVLNLNHNSIYYRSNTVIIEFEYYFNSIGENLTFYNNGINPFVFKCFGNNEKKIVFDILFDKRLAHSKTKDISKILNNIIINLNFDVKYSLVPFSLDNTNYFKYNLLKNQSKQTVLEFAVNLEDEIEDIWRSLRKSYKSLINKNNKIFTVNNVCTHEIWESCKKLHYECSGKKTRSDQTWEIQWQAIESGKAIVYYIQENNEVIGFAYFIYDKNFSSYYVAAFKRDNNSDHSLGHLILWHAIKKFKDKGLKKLYLGSYPIKLMDQKSKISNIIGFKKAFSNIINISFE